MVGILLLTGVVRLRGKPERDVAAALRELLLARAQGQLSAEEFETRQAALHAELVAAPSPLSPAAARAGGKKFADSRLRWAFPAGIAIVAVAAYLIFGNQKSEEPTLADLPPTVPALSGLPQPAGKAQSNSGGDLKTMAKRLAEKMEKDPKNGEGWLLLARTYGELREPAEADKAYAKAAALLPPEATMLADWADAHVMARDRKWDNEARDIVKRALATDPKHLKVLALAGSEAFERADYKQAIVYWKRMQDVAAPGSMDAKLADSNIQEANAALTGKKPEPVVAQPAVATGAIAGTVTLDARLKDKVAPGDTIFVVAKATDGSAAPLAVRRFQAAELPIKFQLDDSAAMVPGRNISKFGEVVVSARLSKSGEAIAQPADILSKPVRTKSGAVDVKLELAAP